MLVIFVGADQFLEIFQNIQLLLCILTRKKPIYTKKSVKKNFLPETLSIALFWRNVAQNVALAKRFYKVHINKIICTLFKKYLPISQINVVKMTDITQRPNSADHWNVVCVQWNMVVKSPLFINSLSDLSFVKISLTNLHSKTAKARELTFWDKVHIPNLSHVMCTMSHATCQMPHVTWHESKVTYHVMLFTDPVYPGLSYNHLRH